MTNRFPPKEYQPSDEVVLKVEGLCSPLPKSFQDVELPNSKRRDPWNRRIGRRPENGTGGGHIRTEGDRGRHHRKDGKPMKIKSPRDAIRENIALLTEERGNGESSDSVRA